MFYGYRYRSCFWNYFQLVMFASSRMILKFLHEDIFENENESCSSSFLFFYLLQLLICFLLCCFICWSLVVLLCMLHFISALLLPLHLPILFLICLISFCSLCWSLVLLFMDVTFISASSSCSFAFIIWFVLFYNVLCGKVYVVNSGGWNFTHTSYTARVKREQKSTQ